MQLRSSHSKRPCKKQQSKPKLRLTLIPRSIKTLHNLLFQILKQPMLLNLCTTAPSKLIRLRNKPQSKDHSTLILSDSLKVYTRPHLLPNILVNWRTTLQTPKRLSQPTLVMWTISKLFSKRLKVTRRLNSQMCWNLPKSTSKSFRRLSIRLTSI